MPSLAEYISRSPAYFYESGRASITLQPLLKVFPEEKGLTEVCLANGADVAEAISAQFSDCYVSLAEYIDFMETA